MFFLLLQDYISGERKSWDDRRGSKIEDKGGYDEEYDSGDSS